MAVVLSLLGNPSPLCRTRRRGIGRGAGLYVSFTKWQAGGRRTGIHAAGVRVFRGSVRERRGAKAPQITRGAFARGKFLVRSGRVIASGPAPRPSGAARGYSDP